jgi:hypothetical protein
MNFAACSRALRTPSANATLSGRRGHRSTGGRGDCLHVRFPRSRAQLSVDSRPAPSFCATAVVRFERGLAGFVSILDCDIDGACFSTMASVGPEHVCGTGGGAGAGGTGVQSVAVMAGGMYFGRARR